MTFRFLHAADLHLDTPFQGLARTAPDVRERLCDAALAALDLLVDNAIRREVDLVVIAGDVYDGPERGLRAQLKLQRAAERLDAAGITTCMVHGNHDPIDGGWTAIERWPERFHVIGTEVETVSIDARDGTRVHVHGVSYARPDVTENLALRFPRVSGDGFHVGLLHANVGGVEGHKPYSPCSLEDLRRTGHHYWALGHVHQGALLFADPWIAYPGNLCGRSFRETGAKGALLVEVAGGRARPEPLALDPVRFLRLPIDVAGAADVGDLARAIAARGDALRAEHPGRALCVRVELEGRGPASRTLLSDEGASLLLLEELRERTTDGAHPLWWADVIVRVVPELDLDRLRGGDDLAAAVIEIADELAADDLCREARIRDLLDALPRGRRLDGSDALVRDALLDALQRLGT